MAQSGLAIKLIVRLGMDTDSLTTWNEPMDLIVRLSFKDHVHGSQRTYLYLASKPKPQNKQMQCRISPRTTCSPCGYTMKMNSRYHRLLMYDVK